MSLSIEEAGVPAGLDAARNRPAVTLRSRFSRLLAAAVVLPALVFGIFQLVSDFRSAEANVREQVRLATRLTATSIEQFLEEHASAVGLSADHASEHGEDPHLGLLHQRYAAFITVLSADRDGRIIAAEPAARAAGVRFQRVDDRDYFRGAATTLQPYVSDAFVGRGLGNEPLVAVSAPLMRDGAFSGIVEGSIRIDTFTRLRSTILRSRRQEMLILDRTGHVVYASDGLGYRFLQPVGDACPVRGQEGLDGVSPAQLCRSVLRGGGDAWTAWTPLRSGWRVALFSPRDPLYSAMLRHALSMLVMLVLAVSGALIVARWQMRRLEQVAIAVLERLRWMASGARGGAVPLDSVPQELRPVAAEVTQLVARLETANGELRGAFAREQALAESLRAALGRQEQEIHARTLELQAANRELERISRTDALTGMLNVRGFQSACDELVDEAGGLRAPLGVITFDVDHFKAFNDRYGHPLGDRVLRRVAGVAQACLRDAGDRMARAGGEEFVALLPGADLATTQAVAERIRSAALALGIRHEDEPGGCVSVSIGVVAAARSDLLEGVLAEADAALYRAKSGGRNRVST